MFFKGRYILRTNGLQVVGILMDEGGCQTTKCFTFPNRYMNVVFNGTIKTIETIGVRTIGVCEVLLFSVVNSHVFITPLRTEGENLLDLFLG